jgi:hypothetical protein
MSQPKLPLEIRSIIYNLQDDFNLAKQSSNCFWAIAPHYFKNLTIGLGFEEDADILLQTELAGLWSDTGRFVETLTLHPENSRLSLSSIGFFLRNNENFEKLTHLRLSSSSDDFELASELPFHDPLVNCLKKMKNLTRFSFINIQPCSILMGAAGETLTRVDFGYGFPRNNDDYICLPGKIQILTLTSSAAPLLYGAPENLRVLILKDDVHYPDFAGDVYRIIDACPRLTSLALVDPCEYTAFSF